MLQPLRSLMADGIADPTLDAAAQGIADHEVLIIRLRNQLSYQVTIGAAGETPDVPRAVKVAVSWQPEDATSAEGGGAQAKEAEAQMARLGGWVFRIPGTVAAQMLATSTSLLTQAPPPAPVVESVPAAGE
jgi:hypothetical protein